MKAGGNFIVFEGIDGSGKSTQSEILCKRLREKEVKCYLTREPTDSPIGSVIHNIMTGRIKADNKVIAALFAADRLDHLLNDTDGIIHKINDGITVISDRYYMSSYAYHSVDMPMEWIIQANSQSADILRPDINIFIDISPEKALERIQRNRFHAELYEKLERLRSVREKYMEAFEKLKNEENVLIINGDRDSNEIADDVWMHVNKLI